MEVQSFVDQVPPFENVNDIEKLTAMLRDEDWEVRARAAVTLGRLGDSRAVEALGSRILDENEDTATLLEVVEALRKIGDSRAIPYLEVAQNWDVNDLTFFAEMVQDNAIEAIKQLKQIDSRK